MTNFIQKKDYWSLALYAWVFIGCYFLSKELSSNNLLVVLPVTTMGTIIGYKVCNWVTDKSTGKKVILVLIWSLLFFGSLSIKSGSQNDSKNLPISTFQRLLMGNWETDENEGFRIRLEIGKDKAYMSLSPDYQKIEYDLLYSDKTIQFKEAGILKFQFSIENIDDTSFTLSQSGETLVFKRFN